MFSYTAMLCLAANSVIGALVAIAYIVLVYGANHKAKQPLKRCNLTMRPLLINGSLFIYGTHVHHWTLSLSLLPAALCFEMWGTAGFLATMTLHGLSYPDALDFGS